ncbi:endo-1,4-beta-xylanase [Mucilaginibacter sp. SP1R1]|uniref:endo-1,4-beta-xylanase n=1 Tax=Mucilaginibacter sp. SP1R1 TaxID=2723091 RepID=UPI00161CA956|nr:endo-1,4-beta-xylanase [Mucilaginibacter sp. SP1R1]MBB6149116.1 endo-1,4-beta-xylanase [Mucilaginibacter sp. SP1R1]
MNRKYLQNSYWAALAIIALLGTSCKKNQVLGVGNYGNFTDTAGTLKSAANFPIGLAAEYALATAPTRYWATVKREASAITFGNELKNSSVLKDNGTYDFTTADAFYNLATSSGLQVYGHTLVWHSQQNTTYYSTIVGSGSATAAPNLLTNGDFETGSGNSFDGWSAFNGSGSFSATTTTGEVHGGSRALKVVVATDNPGKQYTVQFASPLFNTESGKVYKVTFWLKAAANATGAIRLSTQNSTGGNSSYEGDQDVTTTYNQYTWTFTAKDPQTRILLDMGQKANTYWVDDISVVDNAAASAPTGDALVTTVDNAMKTHIQTVVGHYAGKIKQWDVINEPFTDAGALRDNSNTPAGSGIFVWQNYLGRNYAASAFNYAHQADPAAELFMNEYNLETSTAKLNAFVQLANDLKTAGVPITGVGTQLHISIGTPKAGIDNMFIALAATGLKVRISELDIRANPGDQGNFTLTPFTAADQAVMYKYVVWSYFKYVPTAQRAGITIWGVDDPSSWIITSQKKSDLPDLFNADFTKKAAYVGFKQGLQGKTL